MDSQTRIGITCLSDFILSESPEAVVANLVEYTRATAVTLNPTVTEPARKGRGSFQPPSDGGSSPRAFDRPLWGRTRLWVRAEPSYEPDARLYDESAYRPRQAGELTKSVGGMVRRFIDLAHDRGLEVSFQIGAAAPPGLRDGDRPRLPGGGLADHPMARTASLASPAVRSYYRAFLTDLLRAYPDVDCIRVDWPEYPCYTIDETFADFHPAAAIGKTLEHEIGELRNWVRSGLSDHVLHEWKEACAGGAPFEHLCRRWPALDEWLHAKRRLAIDYLRFLRTTMNDAGAHSVALAPNAFPPPFSLLTGLPFADLHQIAPWVAVKLYTMHWLQIVRFWMDDILVNTPGLDPALLAETLLLFFDVGDTLARPLDADSVRYPEPDEPHPVDDAAQRRKITQARLESTVPVAPIVHGYGPDDDFSRRFRTAVAAAMGRVDGGCVWVNRYGYLSDAKLGTIGS